jgi:hypothetical protein
MQAQGFGVGGIGWKRGTLRNGLDPVIDINFGIYSKVGDSGLALNFDTIV